MSALVSVPDDLLPMTAKEPSLASAASAYPYALAAAVGKDMPHRTAAPTEADTRLALSDQVGTQEFSARIQLLVRRAGGANALAQYCGVTERTVRNWSHGRSDISRDRCLVLARAMRISPLWLISGEGRMSIEQAEPEPATPDAREREAGVDSERLAAALQVLQSYIALAGGSLSIAQRAEAVVELYGLLAQPGPIDAERFIAFHRRLAAYLRANRQALIA